jgi:hypothetical protein
MKKFLIKVLIGLLALCAGIAVVKYFSPETNVKPSFMANNNQVANDFSKQREERENFYLESYEPIIVSKINGWVEIEYADVTETEVKVIRYANNEDDFDYRNLVIGESRHKLQIRMKKSPSLWSALGFIPEERQRVIIKTPRGTRVTTNCINGTVEERETIEGRLEVKRNDYQCSQ